MRWDSVCFCLLPRLCLVPLGHPRDGYHSEWRRDHDDGHLPCGQSVAYGWSIDLNLSKWYNIILKVFQTKTVTTLQSTHTHANRYILYVYIYIHVHTQMLHDGIFTNTTPGVMIFLHSLAIQSHVGVWFTIYWACINVFINIYIYPYCWRFINP